MKKKISTLIMGFLFATSTFAITGTQLPVNSNDIGFDSVVATMNVTSITPFTPADYQTFLIAKKMGDSVVIFGNPIVTNGIGRKTSGIYGLMYGTTYQFWRVFKQGNVYDTIYCGTFTTLAKPSFPTISVVKQPAVSTSLLIITVTGADRYYPQITAFYGNRYDSTSNTITGTGTFTDTIRLTTPNANIAINYCLYFEVSAGVPVADDTIVKCDSLRTPSLMNAQLSLNTVSNLTTNSARTSVSIMKGSFNGTLKRILKDSLGVVVRTLQDTAVTAATGTYPADYTGLSADKFYKYYFIYSDQLRTDTVWGSFRTAQRALVPAPTVTVSPSITSNCGMLTLTQFTVTPISGDTASAHVVMSITGNFNDSVTVESFFGITSARTIYNTDILNLPANTRVYLKVIATSVDGLKNESNVVSGLTPPIIMGPTMDIAIINNNTANPKLQVIANGNCDRATGFIEIKQNGFTVRSITISIGSGSYDSLIDLSTLPEGDYVVEAVAKTAMFPNGILRAVAFHKGLATGIKENFSKKPDAEVIVYNYMGTELWSGKYSLLQYETQLFGKYIIVYDVESGRGFHTSIGYQK